MSVWMTYLGGGSSLGEIPYMAHDFIAMHEAYYIIHSFTCTYIHNDYNL